MTNEGERSTAADKGKGKVEDVSELNSKKPQNDEKAAPDGKKKDDEPQEGRLRLHQTTDDPRADRVISGSYPQHPGAKADTIEDELSEEDQQLKDELEMLVERLKVRQCSSEGLISNDVDVDANIRLP
jgi:26S proteasome regulatory subunit N1